MVTELIFSLEMDPEKPVGSPPLTYLKGCQLSLGKTTKGLPLTPIRFSAPLYNQTAGVCSLHPGSTSCYFLLSTPHTHTHTCTLITNSYVLTTMVSSRTFS